MDKKKVLIYPIIIVIIALIVCGVYDFLLIKSTVEFINSPNMVKKSELIYEDGWIFKDNGEYADVIGREPSYYYNKRVVLPKSANGKPIKYFLWGENFDANFVYIPEGNYTFAKDVHISARAFIFLSVNPAEYSNGFMCEEEYNPLYLDYSVHIFVPKNSIDAYKTMYALKGIQPSILPANISLMYNYEGATNDGYYWVDDRYWFASADDLSYSLYGTPTRQGYTFIGWSSTPDGNQLLSEQEAKDLYRETGELVLFAKWEKND